MPHTPSFDEAESTAPVEELTLSPEDLEGTKPIPLRFVKYQNVNSIHFFIADTQGGGDVTAIERLVLFGVPLETTNMNELKKAEEE